MSSFLEKTARHLLSRYGSDLSEICIVLPNRRAGLFLNRFLAAELTRPVWAPALFSIEEFMASLAGMKEVEPIHLLIDLFEIHRETSGEKAQPFDEFLSWGPQLLADFNEIDRYMADAGELFGYLNEVRAISLWNLDLTPLTDFQKNYLAFYNSLGNYYALLTSRLKARGDGYQGLVFREAACRTEQGTAMVSWKQVIFVGFNALTHAEERVMTHLQKEGMAEFLWDADRYYLDSTFHEAGDFLRQWLSKWPAKETNWISEDFLNGEKRIEIIGVPDVTGQVKFCGELLQEMGNGLDERTAVVLADETLLMPLLNSIPAGVENLNVTMGLPLRNTPLADLLEIVLQMHLKASGMQQDRRVANGLYFRDVLKILKHPLVAGIADKALSGNHSALASLTSYIQSGSRVFLHKSDLHQSGHFEVGFEFLDPFFEPWNGPADSIPHLRKIVEMVRDSVMTDGSGESVLQGQGRARVEAEYAFSFTKILHQLADIVTLHPDCFSLQTFCQFFRQLVRSSSLPFYGEPLKGLQVMGMLETRTLDFENLVVLSCNEGLLPSGRTAHSFIPFDIKREFGLPTYQHKDAVYSYHFYRLLQRAKNVWLLYGTEPDQLGGGEKSRYLQQLSRELPLYNPAIKIREQLLTSALPKSNAPPPIVILKSGEVLDRLLEKASEGVAPTALNAFRNCPLRFYFSEIAGLREPEEVTEDIDPRTLGTAVHRALHQLLLPIQNKVLTTAAVKEMIARSDDAVQQAFDEKFKKLSVTSGKNLLLLNVARFMVKNFLKSEIEHIEELAESGLAMQVMFLEHHLNRRLMVSLKEQTIEVIVKGVVDRIDRVGTESRVIDYKTGLTEKKELTVSTWPDLSHNPQLDKAFQLLTYAWLFAEQSPNSLLRAGIISLKNISSGFMPVNLPVETEANQDEKQAINKRGKPGQNDKIGDKELLEFEKELQALVAEIYNPDEPFIQTIDHDTCLRCPYIAICGR